MPVRDLLSAASGTGAPADPYFYDVSLLLNGDGTNGAQNNTFLDSSTNNFTITRNGNTTQGSFSPYGNLWSNYFTTSNYLTAPANAAFQLGSGDFTIEAWIFPTATAGSSNSEIISYGASGQLDGWHFYQVASTNVLSFGLNYSGLIVSSSAALTLNQWTHVAITRSGTTFKLWINGVNDGTATSSTSQSTNGSDLLYVGTGSYSQGADRSFIGYISNARVVKGSVVYTTTFTPSTTPLTAISGTSLLTCQSNRFIDNSSNAFAITVVGTPSVQRFSPFNPTAPYSTSVIGGSGYFDGSDSLNTASNAAFGFGTGSWTLEAWVYPTTAQTDNWILTTNDSGNLRMRIFNGNLGFYTDTGAIGVNSSTAITVNAWNHLAICYDGTDVNLYQNGVRTATSTQSINNGSANSLYIGAYAGGAAYLTGYISQARVVKGTAVYTGTSYTVPTAPVTAVSGTSLLANMTNAGIPDLAMQNNLETVGNAQVSTSIKKYGTGSLAFDGNGDSILSVSSPLVSAFSGNFTVECWVYINSLSSPFFIWTNSIANSDGMTISFVDTNGAISTGKQGVNDITSSSGLVSTGSWNHFAYVGNNGTVTVYLNGSSVASGTQSTYISTSTKPITLGRNYQTSPSYSNGYIDDFRVSYGLARYTATFTPPTAALPTY